MLMRVYGRSSPRLKHEALVYIRSAMELIGLDEGVIRQAAETPVSSNTKASLGDGKALKELVTKSVVDERLVDPLLTSAYGLIVLGVVRDAVAKARHRATAEVMSLSQEAIGAFRLSLALSGGQDVCARVGLNELKKMDVSTAAEEEEATGGGVLWDPSHVNGTTALHDRLEEYLRQQRRAAAWLAGDKEEGDHLRAWRSLPSELGAGLPAELGSGVPTQDTTRSDSLNSPTPPRILIGHIPAVGLGNQVISVIGYLAHAILTKRALFLQGADLQCDDKEDGDDEEGSKWHNTLLCDAFDLVGEGGGGGGRPLWRLVDVLERSRTPDRLQRLYAAASQDPDDDASEYNLRPIPGKSHAVQHLTCEGVGDGPAILIMKSPLWYVPLLELNENYHEEITRLFKVQTTRYKGGLSAAASGARASSAASAAVSPCRHRLLRLFCGGQSRLHRRLRRRHRRQGVDWQQYSR